MRTMPFMVRGYCDTTIIREITIKDFHLTKGKLSKKYRKCYIRHSGTLFEVHRVNDLLPKIAAGCACSDDSNQVNSD